MNLYLKKYRMENFTNCFEMFFNMFKLPVQANRTIGSPDFTYSPYVNINFQKPSVISKA